MPKGQRHLIRCRCVLNQFKNLQDPPPHQFVAFSVINDDETIVEKYSQCNNCGLVHKIIDICRSEIVGKESMSSILSIDDIKLGLPANLTAVLEKYNVEIAGWEHAQFIIENKVWGDFVLLTSEMDAGKKQGKYVRILGENMLKVENFERNELIDPGN